MARIRREATQVENETRKRNVGDAPDEAGCDKGYRRVRNHEANIGETPTRRPRMSGKPSGIASEPIHQMSYRLTGARMHINTLTRRNAKAMAASEWKGSIDEGFYQTSPEQHIRMSLISRQVKRRRRRTKKYKLPSRYMILVIRTFCDRGRSRAFHTAVKKTMSSNAIYACVSLRPSNNMQRPSRTPGVHSITNLGFKLGTQTRKMGSRNRVARGRRNERYRDPRREPHIRTEHRTYDVARAT